MPRGDTWDTPGGPGGRDELEEIERIVGASRAGAARALYISWQEAVSKIAAERNLKATVNPVEFNAFRRARNKAGVTDDQLAVSFAAFAVAVEHDLASVRHGDAWRAYASGWARWISAAPAPSEGPLKGRRGSPPRQL